MPPTVAELFSYKFPEVSQWDGSDNFSRGVLAWLSQMMAIGVKVMKR